MNSTSLSTFERAICATHGADQAMYTGQVDIRKVCEDRAVWEGEVLIFILEGHPTASRCYAWEEDGEVTSVLHEGAVTSPEAAVRSVIMADELEPAGVG